MSVDPIDERAAKIFRLEGNNPRVKDLPKAEREERAGAQAESDVRAEKRRLAVRAERERQRAVRDAAITDLAAKAGVSRADAAEAIRRRRKAERLKGIARAEDLLAGETAHHDASPVASADIAAARRSAGRTAWDDDWLEFDRRLAEAEGAAGATFANDPEAVAKKFRPLRRPVNGQIQRGVEPETLRRLVRRRANAGAISSG